jgi:chromosome condensin MukBEF MukE localization factor
METEKNAELPRLAEVFDALRKGRHLAPDDADLYFNLHNSETAFTELFAKLGFELKRHPRDFYYFKGEADISDTSSRMAVFMFILVETLADSGASAEEQIMTSLFFVDKLEHLRRERYRDIMLEAGMPTEEELRQTLRTMERFGFLKMENPDSFRFKAPAYRFLDLCMELFKESEAAEGKI